MITYRFKEYLPEIGACVKTIRNEARGEEYERKGYVYTVPLVQVAMGDTLELERHIILTENCFLDVFQTKKQAVKGERNVQPDGDAA